MKIIISFIVLIFHFAHANEFDCGPKQPIKWVQLSEGVDWVKYDLSFSPYDKENHTWANSLTRSVTVRAFKIDLSKNKLLFVGEKSHLACNPVNDRYIQKIISGNEEKIIGAINSNFFVMPDGNIQGIAIDENKVWAVDASTQTISSSGVLSIENGLPQLESKDQFMARFGSILSQEDAKRFTFAVQAYPKLLINHELQITDSVLNTKRPRTSIGFGDDQEIIYLFTIDARGENDQTGMSLFEYAHFLKTEKCGVNQKTVLNLDGGGSTSFAVPALKIYEQADRCRHLGNILTIQKRI